MIDYFAENLWQMWALVSIVCLILELTNGDFFIICFAIGAACSAFLSALGLSFYAGLAVFAVTSVLSLFFVRPAMLKHLHRNEDSRVSNADAIIGRVGKVTETIKAGDYGRMKLDGDDWKAESDETEDLPVGTKVRIIGRESIIVKVEKA